MTTTLCWNCKNACGKCSWSKKFKKVKGWVAKKTIVKGDPNSLEPEIPSYLVISCPKFQEDDKPCKVNNKGVAQWLGINVSTYLDKTTLEQREKNKQLYLDYLISQKKKEKL